ncbi:hypothetical protein CXB72_04675 [Lactobacillus acidophilus]|uniref:YjcQ family protein n=1 Tax=Lactobacillus acidophilus TaxID=1579 RepID=UPI000F75937F|nr:YjcQ family protein [Lactobacillus acidophilus]AZN76471.1 hypothetical protein CXB72_04675 [Lactobacillus acidophilus]
MAKDDYFVIAYKLLTILYVSLKSGKTISNDQLKQLSEGIPFEYWEYILKSLNEECYVTGVISISSLSGDSIKITNLQITPKGIEYLQDNSKMQKVKDFLKETRSWFELLAQFK